MPTKEQYKDAINFAKSKYVEESGEKYYVISDGDINSHLMVDIVRQYFNNNDITYVTFSFKDLKPHLTELGILS